MTDVSIGEILLSREERVRLQREIADRFQCPLISFTMNIAGPVKNSALIARAFRLGLKHLDSAISEEKIVFKHIDETLSTGPLAIYAVNDDLFLLKDICVKAEEKTALGRLFDMDVLDQSLQKLTRDQERGCIICAAPGRACAAGRIHSVYELQDKMNAIMTEEILSWDSRRIAEIATKSLIREVETTPKPGLVDMNNSGSHDDMCVETFKQSAYALSDYFKECIEIGAKHTNSPYDQVFLALRQAGIRAEKCMYNATGGVNTHKGAIFSFGVLCGAVGRLWKPQCPIPETDELLAEASEIAKIALDNDFPKASGATAGERMYIENGATGIRGEAASGFSSVRNLSLPLFRDLLQNKTSTNEAGAITLLHLIANVDDSAIYKRGGLEGLRFAQKYAKKLLQKEKIPHMKRIEEMDTEFIQKNLSAGGSADLLAVTYFMYELEELSKTAI